MPANASRTIKSAHRVLEILEFFDQDRRDATVMDLSRSLNYPQSSTSELLRCLARLGYLHYNRFRRTCSPTTRVALLGAWAKPSLFRGGPVLSAIDEVAEQTGETVLLSTGANYVLQHLHVIHGTNPDAYDAHGGDTQPMLRCPQGRLVLSSYRNEQVRAVVHRLNAEESDPTLQVRMADALTDMSLLRERGWLIEQDAAAGIGCIAVMLPVRRNVDRLVLSVQARAGLIADRGEEIRDILLRQRDRIAQSYGENDRAGGETNVVQMPLAKVQDHQRHYA